MKSRFENTRKAPSFLHYEGAFFLARIVIREFSENQ